MFIRMLENYILDQQPLFIWTDDDNCFFPGGTKGPHMALESPERNSAHFLTLVSNVINAGSANPDICRLGMGLVTWLQADDNPYRCGDTFIMRQKKGVDSVNGVIGPAWVVEALVMASQAFNCVNALGLAKRVAAGHRFNWKSGVWCRNDVKNKIYRPDLTLDHQVMFAHAAGLCGMLSEVDRFLSACETGLLRVRASGRIHHLAFVGGLRCLAARGRYKYQEVANSPWVEEVEHAYHIYTLFGLSLLRQFSPSHSFFESERFVRAMRYFTAMDMESLRWNPLGFGYNNPFFSLPAINKYLPTFNPEIAFADDIPALRLEDVEDVISTSVALSVDPLTQKSRVYELSYGILGN